MAPSMINAPGLRDHEAAEEYHDHMAQRGGGHAPRVSDDE